MIAYLLVRAKCRREMNDNNNNDVVVAATTITTTLRATIVKSYFKAIRPVAWLGF